MSEARLVVNVVDTRVGGSRHEIWSGGSAAGQCEVRQGLSLDPNVSEYVDARCAPPSREWVVHLAAGDAVGLYPLTGPLRRELEVFDPEQRVSAVVTVREAPYGPLWLRFDVDGPALVIQEVSESSVGESADIGPDLQFELTFAELVRWLHLETAIGPALWFSGQIFGLDVFALSLLDGVVSAPATDPPIGPLAIEEAVDVACRFAAVRAASATADTAAVG